MSWWPDVVFSYERQNGSAKRIPTYFDHVAKVEALDKHTVLFRFKEFNAEWDYRFGWGYYPASCPGGGDRRRRQLEERQRQRPLRAEQLCAGQCRHLHEEHAVLGQRAHRRQDYKLPFVDKLVIRTVKDEATRNTMLRTGKLDIAENVRWTAVEELKKSAPALKWSRWLSTNGQYRRCASTPSPSMTCACAARSIWRSTSGRSSSSSTAATRSCSPTRSTGLRRLLRAAQRHAGACQELFTYNPDKARKLLAEAGYPKGFSFKVQVCACDPNHMELLPLIGAYPEQVGVRIEIQPMEYGAFLSAMTTRTNAPGYLMSNGHTNPTTTIRKWLRPVWNASQWGNPKFEQRVNDAFRLRDVGRRRSCAR